MLGGRTARFGYLSEGSPSTMSRRWSAACGPAYFRGYASKPAGRAIRRVVGVIDALPKPLAETTQITVPASASPASRVEAPRCAGIRCRLCTLNGSFETAPPLDRCPVIVPAWPAWVSAGPPVAPSGVVTFLFTDVEGSTRGTSIGIR